MNPMWVQLLNAGKIMRLNTVFFLLLALVAQPASAESSPSLWNLERQLAILAAGTSGDVGIAALDLQNGTSVSIRGNEPFPMASTVKVAIAALYLAQVDHGDPTLPGDVAVFLGVDDVGALEDGLLRVSAMVEDLPQIAELDCNPFVVREHGAVILDARVRVVAPPPRTLRSVRR